MKKDFFLNLVSCVLLFFIFFNLIFIFVLKRNYGNVRLNLYFELVAFVLLIIIDNYKKDYVNSKDYIIILRKEAINKSYNELENELIALLNKEGKDDEKQEN